MNMSARCYVGDQSPVRRYFEFTLDDNFARIYFHEGDDAIPIRNIEEFREELGMLVDLIDKYKRELARD